MVFAVHPVLTQAVAWIPGRNDSLLGIFVMSSFICMIKFLERGEKGYLFWHIAFLLLALLTKEAALAFLPAFIFYYAFVMKRNIFSLVGMEFFTGWSLSLWIWYALRHNALSGVPLKISASFEMGEIANSCRAVLIYLGKVILPLNLSIIPTVDDTTVVYGTVAIILMICGLIISKHKRYRFIIFGIVWFVSFLAPTFIRPAIGISPIFLESRMYLPILGIFMILAEIDFVKRVDFTGARPMICALVIVVILFSISSGYSQNFQNAVTFWESAVKESPHSPMAQYNLGWVFSNQGRFDEAEGRFRRTLLLNPRQRYAHSALGDIYEQRGHSDMAEREYLAEIDNTPYSDTAYSKLSYLYLRQGKVTKAKELADRALQLNPDNVSVRELLNILKANSRRKASP